MDAITDDYYDELSLKFLINEYHRVEFDVKHINNFIKKLNNP